MAITNVKNSFSGYTLDDFDESKNYQRILFKPGFAVQARELTQLQTALQAQIDKLGQHKFKDGQRVLGGHPTLNIDFDYIKIETVVDPELFLGSTITGDGNTTNQVSAQVLHVSPAESVDGVQEPTTLYIAYNSSGGPNRDVKRFAAGEGITGGVSVGGSIVNKTATIGGGVGSQISAAGAIGVGSEVSISEGVYFISGNFVYVPPETLLLDKFSNTPSFIVGLQINETIISSSTPGHTNLQDNASGSSNASAPGADRYVVSTTLIKQAITEADPAGLISRAGTSGIDNYIHLLTVKNGIPFASITDNTDIELNKMLANRTEEESGDYTVSPFVLDIKEARDDGSNYGHSASGDADQIYIGVEAGTAYVGGHRINKVGTSEVYLDKPRAPVDQVTIGETTQSVGYGNYIELKANETEGLPAISALLVLDLQNASGTDIGTARARDMRFDGARNTPSGVFRLFLFDIKMDAGHSFAEVAKISQDTADGNSQLLNANLFTQGKLFDASNNSLVYQLPAEAISTIRTVDGQSTVASVDAEFRHQVTSGGTTVSGQAITVDLGGLQLASKDDVLIYGGPNVATAGFGSTSIRLEASNFNGVSIGDTSISLQNLPAGFNGSGVTVIFTSKFTNATQKTKTLSVGETATFNVTSNLATSYPLAQHDIIKLTSIIRVNDGAGNSTTDDVTDQFILDGGQRDNFYQEGKIVTKQGAVLLNGNYEITFDHFAHSGTGDYFSVDSYSPGTSGVADIYSRIPSYKGIQLRDAIDFRPTKQISSTNSDSDTFTGGITFANGIIPSESSIELFIKHYKGRIDKLFLTEKGEFQVVKGIPDQDPVPPENIENALHLYTFKLNPYVFGVQDIIVIPIDNRRYTMRDIGALDKRLKNLEYYTSLSLLEKSAAQAEIVDGAGDLRFKNGFVVDGFFGHNVGNPANPEYSVSIDRKNGVLRPKFDEQSINLIRQASDSSQASTNAARATADNGNNKCTTSISGGVVTLPYTIKTELDQPYASYAEFVNPYNVFSWDGTLKLSPESDEWKEVNQRPDVIVNDNSQYDQFTAMAEETGILGTTWNEWETNWTGEEITGRRTVEELAINVKNSNSANSRRVERLTGVANDDNNWRADIRTVTTAIKTTGTSTRTGTQASIESSTTQRVLGNFTVETSYIPFMRARKIFFDAQLMKPNTKVHAFFDGSDVTSFCKTESAFGEFSSIINGDAARTYRGATSHDNATGGTGGGTLTTDATGRLIGSFIIPNNSTMKFKTGTRMFKITDDNTNNDDLATTTAEEPYYAQGLLETKQRTIINTKTAKIVNREVSRSKTISSNRTEVKHELIRYYDPIAESFVIKTDGGIFTTSVELFFNKIDPSIPITVSIREVENGIPTQNIVPGAEKILYSQDIVDQYNAVNSDVTTNTFEVADATHATQINWDYPVHLLEGKEYAIVCISNSDKYKVFVAETSKFDLTNTNYRITKQPFDGVFFTSANASTWTPEQNKDLKFKLNRASFSTNECSLNLINDTIPVENLANNPFTFIQNNPPGNSGKCLVTVKHHNHGMYGKSSNSIHKVTIAGVASAVNNISAASFNKDHDIVNGSQTLDSYQIIVDGNCTAVNVVSGGSAVTASKNLPYNLFKLSTASIEFKDSTIQYGHKGFSALPHDNEGVSGVTSYGVTPTTGFKKILANKNIVMETPMQIASTVNVPTAHAGNGTFRVEAKFKTEKENISPVIDLNRTSAITVANRINDATTLSGVAGNPYGVNYVADTESDNTSNDAKYITKTVELDSSADELDIYLNANKPQYSNIDVFYKVGEDDSALAESDWTQLQPVATIPTNNNGVYSEIHYSKDFGALSTPITFSKFIIKIVLRSRNSANIPTVKDFRAIASI